MAIPVLMPKQGNTVESCIIIQWHKEPGDEIAVGETLCEVETDKAVVEVPSPGDGVLLETFFQVGDEVPVLTHIAVIGEPGEAFDDLRPAASPAEPQPAADIAAPLDPAGEASNGGGPPDAVPEPGPVPPDRQAEGQIFVSPRAQRLARETGLDVRGLVGSGPGGRIIERDVQAALEAPPPISPVAKSMLSQGDYVAPPTGSGPRGRIMARDLLPGEPAAEAGKTGDEFVRLPVQGVRKLIAERMLASLQTSAQLTLNASADARSLLAFRRRLKTSPENLVLRDVTVNDLLLFAVSRILPQYPALNATFDGDSIYQYRPVHLALAVDTPRGLVVPVIRRADQLSLKQLAAEARRLADASQEGKISPDELTGGTFTVTNLGSLGIESFTPILNPPQVAILGVGNVNLKPVQQEDEVAFIPHIGLSLTINHQVVDGAPGARFLQALSQGMAELDLLLAI